MVGKRWTDAEFKILRNNAEKDSHEIAGLLETRTFKAIQSMRKKLGIKIMEHWTEEEKNKLKEIYGKTGIEELSKLLRRSRNSVISKAGKMGLRRKHKTRHIPSSISDLECGIIVGLLEGEGCISLITGKRTNLSPTIEITNTDQDILGKVEEILGPGVWKSSRGNPAWKTSYHYKIGSVQAVSDFLELIGPHLISDKKRKLAQLLLEYCKSRIKTRKGRANNLAPYSQREFEIYHEMRELNKRGVRT